MLAMLTVFALVAFAYLLGSVPSGWIVMKLYRGQDLRRVGSGNIGAANVFRAGGPGAFATTLAADGLKGVLPVLAGILLGYGPQEWVLALIGLAAVVGHNWPVFLGFHGGKGVATPGGVMLVLAPVAVLLTVKSYDTQEAREQLYPALLPGTVLGTFQNGVGNEELITHAYPDQPLLSGTLT